MAKVTMLVAAHKAYSAPKLAGYLPVQVGAKLSDKRLGYQRDDEGENISVKNPQYCELTAQYWAWKNHTCDIIGMVHYRRYFVKDMYAKDLWVQVLTPRDIEDYLQRYEVILPRPVFKLQYNGSLHEGVPKEQQDQPLVVLEQIVQEMCPEYIASFNKYVYGKRASFGNMLVAQKRIFDAYSAWVFPLLEEFEKRGAAAGVMVPRLCGFLSEYLLCIWVDHNIPPEKVLYLDVRNTEENTRAPRYLARKLLVNMGIYEPATKAFFKLYYALGKG